MKTYSKFLLPLAFIWATTPTTHAQVIASDNFNSYTAGAVGGQTGGTGFTGTWTLPSSGTAFANVAASAGLGGGTGLTTGNPTGGAASSAIFGAHQLATPITGQNVYVSFLWQYAAGPGFGTLSTDNTTFQLSLADTATSTSNPLDFGMRATGGTQTFMARAGTGTPPGGGVLNLAGAVGNPSQTYLLVGEYVWNGTGYGSINAWFNPNSSTQTTPDVTATAGTPLTSLSYVMFRGGLPDPAAVFNADNLVIGQSWSDVVSAVPEPGSAALFCLSGVVWFAFSRRNGRSA
jgi:hypothetical protein